MTGLASCATAATVIIAIAQVAPSDLRRAELPIRVFCLTNFLLCLVR